ncbi:class I adenylate-forming enzyme family protein [Vibrio coralliilyticus]|uniref:class I adenylate-forming enzyme family protein n=1 Tax=Vibrio coralliilyticus TaxID=190893 RepID=UPI0005127348|nr:class I adenylate-forming enzyme family protein [Vibrio coralliilyticus]AIU68112.1 hypothetical protein JV59_38520 [Vibrio coralliilyticus]
MIDKILRGDGETIAIEYNETQITYRELEEQVFLSCQKLDDIGVGRGSRVCLKAIEPVDYFVFLLACFTKGAVVCPLSDSYSDEYVHTILDIFQPDVVVLSEGKVELIEQQERHTPCSLQAMGLVTFTSGTTGVPKGVCHSVERLVKCAEVFNKHNNLSSNTKMMHVMPRFYMAGILNTFLSPLVAGGTVVLGNTFSAQNAPVLFKKYYDCKANTIWLSPSMLLLSSKMARDPESVAWLSKSSSKVFVGTAPLPRNSKDFFQDKFSCEVLESYGTSELLFISCAQYGEGQEEGVGRLLDGVKMTFAPDDEILIESPWAMLGYLNAKGNGRESGDIGKLNNEKLLITGRKKDLIIKGGQNISPRYIEEAALEYEGVDESAVVAGTHPFWGEVPILYVLPNDAYCEKSLRNLLGQKLSSDQLPEKIYTVKSFPKTVTGKIVKNSIVQECK